MSRFIILDIARRNGRSTLNRFALLLVALVCPSLSSAQGLTQEAPEALQSRTSMGPASASSLPSLDDIFAEICRIGILHPEIAMSQIQLETGKLKNKMLLSRNNLFGFRLKEYLSFPSWQESILYYKNWQEKKYTDKEEDYFIFLDRIRFASKQYKKHILNFKWEKSCSQIG